MGMLDWIKQLLAGKKPGNKPAPLADGASGKKSTALPPSTAPARSAPFNRARANQSVETSAILPLTIPAAMLNTITLSSDQRRLFLIDDGKLITFPLNTRGVSIGLLDGQLAVITPNKPAPDLEELAEDTVDIEGPAPAVARTAQQKGKEVRLPLRENTQYNLAYNAANQAMGIIGATDIISTITVPDHPGDGPTGSCQLHLFDLSEHILTVQRTKDSLLLTLKARK